MPFALALCVAVVVGSASSVRAQSGAEEEALRHFERGNEHMEAGEFKKAARAFKDSYKAKRAPLLLYNIAQAYRKSGEDRKAIEYYEDFLSEEPNMDPFSDRARKYLEVMRKKLELEEGSGRDDVEEPIDEGDEVSQGDEELSGDFGDEAEEREDLVGDEGTAGSVRKRDPGKIWRYSGLGLMGVGAVSLAVGLKYGYDTYNGWRCLEQYQTPGACDGVLANHDPTSWTQEADEYQKRGFPLTRAKMYIFTGAGTAAIVVGGYIYYRSKKIESRERRRASKLDVAPSVGSDSVGVALTGAF